MNERENNIIGEFGSVIGKGLLAGLAGTAAITISQMIEMSITKRKASEAPAKVAEQVINIKPASKDAKEQVSQEIHWAYGTAWGIARGLIGLTGLKGLPASALHFAAIWGSSMIMLPAHKAAPKVTEEDPKTIAIDGLHHAVYALAAGLAYDALDHQSQREKNLNKLSRRLKLMIKKYRS